MAKSAMHPSYDFVCSVCLDFFNDPHCVEPCKHTFCKICCMTLRDSNISHCPVCRSETNDFCADVEMAQRMDSEYFQCRSCNEEMKASKLNEHQQNCGASLQPEDFNDIAQQRFTCPFCDCDNLQASSILVHCQTFHKDDRRRVVCPICASMPWGDPNRKSANFICHLDLRHKFNFEEYAENELDEETALMMAISASLTE